MTSVFRRDTQRRRGWGLLALKPSPTFPRCNRKPASILGGQAELRKEAHLINKGNLDKRLSWSAASWVSSAPAQQTVKVYIKALTGFSHIYGPDVLNIASLSQGCVLGAASRSGKGQWNPHSKDREGARTSECPGPAYRSTGGHIGLMTFSNSDMKMWQRLQWCGHEPKDTKAATGGWKNQWMDSP